MRLAHSHDYLCVEAGSAESPILGRNLTDSEMAHGLDESSTTRASAKVEFMHFIHLCFLHLRLFIQARGSFRAFLPV